MIWSRTHLWILIPDSYHYWLQNANQMALVFYLKNIILRSRIKFNMEWLIETRNLSLDIEDITFLKLEKRLYIFWFFNFALKLLFEISPNKKKGKIINNSFKQLYKSRKDSHIFTCSEKLFKYFINFEKWYFRLDIPNRGAICN